jgi:nucleoside transporter
VFNSMYLRLSVMIFLQYCVSGAFFPILSHYLKNHLHFDARQAGFIMAMSPVATLIAPLVVVHVANRFLSETRLLSICHILAGLTGLILSLQTSFWAFLGLYFVFGLFFVPTFALTNSITFHNVSDPRKDFGRIRFWGPASWVVVALGFSYIWLAQEPADQPGSRLVHAIVLASLACLALGVYSLTLPKDETIHAPAAAPGRNTLRVFSTPSMIVLCAITMLNSMVHQFYYFGMGPYLSQIGFSNQSIMPYMSLGQVGEMIVFSQLGWFITRLGVKNAMLIGIFAQVARCVVFSTGNPWLTILLIPTHGVCFACYFAVASIYIDGHASREQRAGAQQLFNFLMLGVGNLAGSIFAGYFAKFISDPGTDKIHFGQFWIFSAAFALALGIALAAFFKEEKAVEPGLPPIDKLDVEV